ncbi:transcription cofactor vestigial-like protein 2b isoform X2 [Brachyhypopomus gauderio]|uniref:transcription cofactor vestigial-like protein 2b isoform X2 n=1 Tax=Brachyhypopomus gauderio TaxID=698409 RepID=UPI004041141C
MSCLDVMHPVYGHYAPHTSASPAFISSLPTPSAVRNPSSLLRDLMDTSGTEGVSVMGASPISGPLSSPAPACPPGGQDKRETGQAECLSSRCVLFTYYQGDIGSVVDEHFSRALGSCGEGEDKRRCVPSTEAPSSSSRRSFPPSFWDSNYPSPPGRSRCEALATPTCSVDPYAQALHSALPHPHAHPSDSWGYPQNQAYGPPRPLHELYSPPGLEPHYSPLLMSTVRPAHIAALPGHYDVRKLEHAATWPGLLPPGDMTLALNMDPGLQPHKKAKELYWF